MMALKEAVEVNQVHNRDPIGGSNENLFLYVLHPPIYVASTRVSFALNI